LFILSKDDPWLTPQHQAIKALVPKYIETIRNLETIIDSDEVDNLVVDDRMLLAAHIDKIDEEFNDLRAMMQRIMGKKLKLT
jgi:hypothetical protein